MLLLLKPPTTSIMSSFCSGTSCCPVISYTALCLVCRQHNSGVRRLGAGLAKHLSETVWGALPAVSRGSFCEVCAHALARHAVQSSRWHVTLSSHHMNHALLDMQATQCLKQASWTQLKPNDKVEGQHNSEQEAFVHRGTTNLGRHLQSPALAGCCPMMCLTDVSMTMHCSFSQPVAFAQIRDISMPQHACE